MATEEYNTAIRLFEQIRSEFNGLQMKLIKEPENVDLGMDIPKQPGLDFDINLNLQTDEIHIATEAIWCFWFPMKDEGITDIFIEAVRGLIKGQYRILHLTRNGKLYKARLQKPNGETWDTVYTHHRKISLPWFNFEETEIKNNTKQQSLKSNA